MSRVRTSPLLVRGVSRVLASTSATTRIRTPAAAVVLTYDDGPDPVSTPAVLRVLAEHDASATFFVLADRARLHPGVVRDVVAAGHEIGLHGQDHRPVTDFDHAALLTRTEEAVSLLQAVSGRPIRLFRPPYGRQTVASVRVVRALGLSTVLWNRDAADWIDAAPETRLRRATDGAAPGDVLLLHDAFATGGGAETAVEPLVDRPGLTSAILRVLADRGLAGRSVRDARGGGRLLPGD